MLSCFLQVLRCPAAEESTCVSVDKQQTGSNGIVRESTPTWVQKKRTNSRTVKAAYFKNAQHKDIKHKTRHGWQNPAEATQARSARMQQWRQWSRRKATRPIKRRKGRKVQGDTYRYHAGSAWTQHKKDLGTINNRPKWKKQSWTNDTAASRDLMPNVAGKGPCLTIAVAQNGSNSKELCDCLEHHLHVLFRSVSLVSI